MRLPNVPIIGALVISLAILTMGAQIDTPKGKITLPDSSADGTTWVCGNELAKALGGTLTTEKTYGRPVMQVPNHRVLFSMDTAVVSVDGMIIKMRYKPVERDGCIQLPEEFLGIVQSWFGKSNSSVPQEKKPPKAAESTEKVSISISPEGTRITLEGKCTAECAVQEGEKHLLVTLRNCAFKGPVPATPIGLIARVDLDEGASTIKFSFAGGYTGMERLKFRNPDRLTFLLHGASTATVATPMEKPPQQLVTQQEAAKPQEAPGPLTAPPQKTAAIDVVVLDPGHGGSEVGAEAPDMLEKDLTLEISRKCAKALEKEGIKVLLTRDSDVTLPLVTRTAFANKNQADLLISIHLNASPSQKARGTETYYHSTEATDQWAKSLSDRENGSAAPADAKEGIDLVLWDLAQESYIRQSAKLAEIIQLKFNDLLSTKNRGVHQAPFRVLQGAQMPAVLLEVAFLSNQGEAKKIADESFQLQVAQSLAEAIDAFKREYEEPGPPQ